MTQLFVGLAIGFVIGALAVMVRIGRREVAAHMADLSAPRFEPVEGGEDEVHGWERSVRAMRERQQSNNQ
jgi:hypothetical protein